MRSSRAVRPMMAWLLLSAGMAAAGDRPPEKVPAPASRALIVVGLPGDREHETLFRATARAWRDWLTGPLGFPASEVRTLSGAGPDGGLGDAPATRESIAAEVKALREKSRGDDRAWVFVLGHANVDDGHAFLHLPGPDLRDDEFAALFRDLKGREQVFWITTPAAGWFVPGLSAPGRIVVAATERDKEYNETEFPHALADVARLPTARLDADRDGKVSIREVFVATVEAVEKRFNADKRTPTEHAQLDDDGDGVGTEVHPPTPPAKPDGALASKTFLPMAPR